MAQKRLGKETVFLANPPAIVATAAIVGPMEGKGPLAEYFDVVEEDTLLGEKTWEKAEIKMLQEATDLALKKAELKTGDIDFFLAGDLLNQIIAANFVARKISRPYLGLYGACSTMAEALGLGAMLIDGGFARQVLIGTSSHHDTAERQFRYPTEFGVQRPPTSTWTVTGAGAVVLAEGGHGPLVTHVTIGKVVDMDQKDPNDMGSAMAPAAAETIWQHLQDTGRRPSDYDLIVTGDLGRVGKPITDVLLKKAGYDLTPVYNDCGIMIYDTNQDAHSGGSGTACSAVVFGGYILRQILSGRYRRVLLVGTGALYSPTSAQQGESIPGIAHAVAVEAADVVD
ncbi:MAG: stage V sporulation protein AD [Firmicutes bacterium]|nr:stage V sporulation protein AD [Bacillota bacterium]MCL5038704.1 stage V sporulation protein AD [Bacillota bacterium]